MSTYMIRPMPPRDPHEPHRAATPLELLFDLVTVIAVAAAAGALHHAIAEGYATQGAIRYLMTFFAVWWAWMNFSWFASAYDNDDAIHRVLTMVIMGGALVLAGGIDRFFGELAIGWVVAGYVIMRLGMVAMWLRAAWHDPARQATALRYAGGIAAAQLFWICLTLFTDHRAATFPVLILLGFVIELAVPAFAERANATPWHHHHIAERYGLLTIIVLGEVLTSAAMAIQTAADEPFDVRLIHIALSALVITFAMWWLYFADEENRLLGGQLHHALQWGYGHSVVFAAGAAVGAGFGVLVDIVSGHANLPVQVGDFAVAWPLAAYLLGLWFVRDRMVCSGSMRWVLPAFACLIALVPLVIPALEVIAALAVASLVARYLLRPAPQAG
ncbi:MAG: low temperature requirement protein A [Sphingomonadales bacterium]|nr:low temperature requirement protein A [Sphingomonadales bacterium]MBD3772427.1 low temperature requirement protein A [Paracoccaceae bacterium]MBD3813823.1 low temperature requirement protein A [Betaproteobacteria bacterium]